MLFLAEDTKKLSQQENEIRKYANDLYRQKKICQQQSDKIVKQTQAFQNLSKINDELCIKVNQLARLQNVEHKLEEKTKQSNVLAGNFNNLQVQHSNLNNRFEEMKQLINSLESEREEARKGKNNFEEELHRVQNDLNNKCKEVEELKIVKEDQEEELQIYEKKLR